MPRTTREPATPPGPDARALAALLETGEAGVAFMGVRLLVGDGVIAPRRETEILVEAASEILAGAGPEPRVVDLCCGCGNVGLVLAIRYTRAQLALCDLAEASVASARRNVARLGLGRRVAVRGGDLFAALEDADRAGGVDLVVANPPYISSARLDRELAHLWRAEPREAFEAGPYGLAVHQRLLREAPDVLAPGGVLAFEFGVGQERQVAALAARTRAYDPCRFACDAAGAPRVAILRRKPQRG